MKRTLILLFLPFASFADKYCEVTVLGKPFSRKDDITIDYGDSLSTVKFTNVPTMLNYLSSKGWVVVAATPAISGGGGSVINKIYLKKED